MAHSWPPLPWNTPSRTTTQVPKERLWPDVLLYFQVLSHSHSLASKWIQIDKMESFQLGTELGNQITPAKPGPHLLPSSFIGMQSSKMEICFPCSFMTLLLPDYPTLWQFASLCACGKWNKLPWNIGKILNHGSVWLAEWWHWGWIQMARFILLQTVMPALMGATGLCIRLRGDY